MVHSVVIADEFSLNSAIAHHGCAAANSVDCMGVGIISVVKEVTFMRGDSKCGARIQDDFNNISFIGGGL
jgi:hypothetical protein